MMVQVTFLLCLTENKLAKFLFCFISQHLIANSDNSSVVVHLFSSPFAAQLVRILPKNHNKAQCMRVDLFGCRDCKCSLFYKAYNIF